MHGNGTTTGRSGAALAAAIAVAVAVGVVLVVAGRGEAATGALTPDGCVDDNDTDTDPEQGEHDCSQSTNGLAEVDSVTVSPDGKSFYATSEGDDAIVRFTRALD